MVLKVILDQLVLEVKEVWLVNLVNLVSLANKVVLVRRVIKVNAANAELLVQSVHLVNPASEVSQAKKDLKEEKARKAIKVQLERLVSLVFQEKMVQLVHKVKRVKYLAKEVNLVSMESLVKMGNLDGQVMMVYPDLLVNKVKQVFLAILDLMVPMEHRVREVPLVKREIKVHVVRRGHPDALGSPVCLVILADLVYLVKMVDLENLVWKDRKVMQGFLDYLVLVNLVLLGRKETKVIADFLVKMDDPVVLFKKVLVVQLVPKVNLDYLVKLVLMVLVAKPSKVILKLRK